MVKSFILATLVLGVFSALPMFSAEALWNAAADNIQSGEPITAAGINNIKDVVEDIQVQIDTGAGNDNLGNHTATTNLNMNNRAITSGAGTIRDANGGWVRTYGNTGWYNQTYGGGWNMTDSTWLRAYGNKSIITSGNIRGARFEDASNSGYFVDPAGRSQIVNMDMNDYIRHRGDTNTHIGFSGNDTIRLRTSGVDQLSVMSSGNVGIGTTAPTARFESRNDGLTAVFSRNTTQRTQFYNNSSGAEIESLSPTTNAKGLTIDSTNPSNAAPTSGSNFVRINVRGTEALRVEDGGNVGIGTSNPAQKLDVAGNADFDTGGDYTSLGIGSDSFDRFYADNTASKSRGGGMWFRIENAAGTGYSDTLRLAENGSVGINVNPSASYKLDVGGTVNATAFRGNGGNLTGIGSAAIANNSLTASDLAANSVNASEISANAVGASEIAANAVGLSELSATGTANNTRFLRGDNTWAAVGGDNLGNHSASQPLYLNNQPLVSAGGSNFDFIRHNDATNTWNFGSDRADVNNTTSGGGSIATGNIELSGRNIYMGSGTQRIYGDDNTAMYIDSDNPTVTQLIMRDQDDTQHGRLYGTGNGAEFGLMDGDTHWGIRMIKDVATTFNINNTERMRILANGHVGIGTSNPETALHVIKAGGAQPTAIFEQTGASPNIAMVDATNGMRFEYNSGADSLRIQSANTNGSYGGATVAVFDRAGNVGIGTSSPADKLHVDGTVRANRFTDANNTGYYVDPASQSQMNDVRGNIFYDRANTAYYANPASESRFNALRMNGNLRRAATNVGHLEGSYNNVGNNQAQTNPIYTIGSAYNPAATTLSNMYGIGYTSGSSVSFVTGNGSGWGMYLAADGDARTFLSGAAGGNTYLNRDGGNVGINTDNPGRQLDVNGIVRATSFQGNGANLTALNASNISSGTLNLARIANNSIPANKLAANSVSTSELAANAVRAGQIAAGAVRASEIQNGSIVATTELSAGGTKNSSTFLRGDNVWATVPAVNAIRDGTPGNWEVASNSNDDIYTSAALEVRELNNGGAQSGSNAQAPRIAFHWGGRAATQIGMGSAGVVRTFDNPGTGYAPFAAAGISANGNLSSTGNIYASGNEYYGDGKRVIRFNDSWLRLNPSNEFTSGIYAGTLPLRTDGELQAGNNGDRFVVKTNGNVGIGTSSPGHRLEVNSGGADNVANFVSSDPTAYIRLTANNDLAQRIEWANRNGRTAFWNPNTSDALNIVHASGNVGIGTTAPSQKLDVAGNIQVSGSIVAPEGALRDDNGGWVRTYGDTGWYNQTYGGGWNMQDTTWLRAYGNKNILTGGNVRAARYEDNNDSAYYTDPASTSQLNGLDVNSYIRHRGDTNTRIGFAANDTIRLRTAGTDRLQVSSNGNIGIGTTSPLDKLHVAGNTRLSNGAPTLWLNDTDNDNFALHTNDDRLYFMRDDNNNFSYDDGDNDRITMYGVGGELRLGVGTSTPSQKLEVVGNARVTNQVRANHYCDVNGNNCTSPANINNSAINSSRYVTGTVRGGEMSSRNVSTPLNIAGEVTFYSATQDTANYLCRTKTNRPLGYWRAIGEPDSAGWSPYSNLAIAAYDPTSYGSRNEICTSGFACYSGGYHYGAILECYDYPVFGAPGNPPGIN